ncbi:MAG: diguanylate cyclase [Candidatus Coatesbacteria bacterium]|nr:MAG: diguanylate cyclase [Candidatus Coatesbacteria bacterium]
MDRFSLRTRLIIFSTFVLMYVALSVFALYNQLSIWPYTLLMIAASAGLFGGVSVGVLISVVATFLHASSVVYEISLQTFSTFSYYQLIWLILYPAVGVITGFVKRVISGAESHLSELIADRDALVEHDEVTGFYNRKRFFLDLRDETARGKRFGNEVTLVLIRPSFSRELGAVITEEVKETLLKRVSGVILENTRVTDRKARYDDDIIALIIPQPPETLPILIRRLGECMVPIEYIADETRYSADVRLAASMASYPKDATSETALVELAENRLEVYMGTVRAPRYEKGFRVRRELNIKGNWTVILNI